MTLLLQLGSLNRRTSHLLSHGSLLLGLLLCVSDTYGAADRTSQDEMVGTWRVEPSTYTIVPRFVDHEERGKGFIITKDGSGIVFSNGLSVAKTNIPLVHDGFGNPIPGRYIHPADTSMPTNLMAFALELRKDGSFSAGNVPADFFFGWPAMAEASGHWALHTKKDLFGDELQSLSLIFDKPRQGYFERPLSWLHTKPAHKPLIPLSLGEDRGVGLARDTNAVPANREEKH
jgi:hypothetical protein